MQKTNAKLWLNYKSTAIKCDTDS